LKLLDQVQLEFDGDPGGELEGDILMGVGTAVAASTGNKCRGAGRIDPTFGGKDEAVQPRLLFNPIEFDGIKGGVVQLFPDAEELDGVAIAHPVRDEVVGAFGVPVAGDVGEADVVLPIMRKHGHVGALHRDEISLRLIAHRRLTPRSRGHRCVS